MKNILFEGCGTALVTPFTEDLKDVNLSVMEELIEFQIKNNTDALIICGTTGESPVLSEKEKEQCWETAVKTVSGRIPVIAGAGSNSTENAVRLCEKAEKQGVNGLLIVTPYYNKTSQEGIIKHYEFIAERTSLPIIVYNVPSRTGMDIKSETYAQLEKIKNISAVKEANGNLSAAVNTLSVCSELCMYSGNDDNTVGLMAIGAKGVISTSSNVIPREMQLLCECCKNNDYVTAANYQKRLVPLMNAMFADVNPMPVKAALNLMGFNVGECRLPLVKPSRQCVSKIKSALDILK